MLVEVALWRIVSFSFVEVVLLTDPIDVESEILTGSYPFVPGAPARFAARAAIYELLYPPPLLASDSIEADVMPGNPVRSGDIAEAKTPLEGVRTGGDLGLADIVDEG